MRLVGENLRQKLGVVRQVAGGSGGRNQTEQARLEEPVRWGKAHGKRRMMVLKAPRYHFLAGMGAHVSASLGKHARCLGQDRCWVPNRLLPP